MRERIKKIPFIKSLIHTNTWQSIRHRTVLITDERKNDTFTGFLRLPSQYEALSGPVMNFLLSHGTLKTLNITIMGCSNGAEAYSIASILRNHHYNLRFRIHAYDIDKEMINKARRASYLSQEIYNNKVITDSFVNSTFDKEKDIYKIKKEISKHVYFTVDDVLNQNLREPIGNSDIVYAQNILIHMKPKIAIKAFNNICRLLKQKAALFIDGIDLGIRQKLTRRNNLVPLEYKIEEIHNEAREARGRGWPYNYWGLESYSPSRNGCNRRYSTIFIKM